MYKMKFEKFCCSDLLSRPSISSNDSFWLIVHTLWTVSGSFPEVLVGAVFRPLDKRIQCHEGGIYFSERD